MTKTFYLTSVALLSLLTLGAAQAMAFSVDEGSNGTPASAQLTDPDDRMPVPSLNLGSGPSKDGSQDAASVHYDYDPQNGTFVPHSPANDQ